MKTSGWVVTAPRAPMTLETRDAAAGRGEVLVRVAGCGVCHTDLGFFDGDVPTRHPLPLTLGHEISGTVVEAGPGAQGWTGRDVIVPAVIPCGDCAACRAGRQAICGHQVFPGNDLHGGFASHVLVPARGLCRVPALSDRAANPRGLDLASLSVIADAISTPYQAARRSGLEAGDLAVFVGAGGVGGFGVQVASAMGAHVVAIDLDPARLELAAAHGASLTLDARAPFKELRDSIRKLAAREGIPTWRQKIFETSGSVPGQETAFGLLGPGGYLAVVGFTPAKATLRLSNLMAFDATARGNWGCPPEHYPAVLEMVLAGRIALEPFIERRPLSSINAAFEELHGGRLSRRLVLVPEPTS
jgi:6-hydroxycyclohex-1-ene-1-carbonyl-CoA dehydrogenase